MMKITKTVESRLRAALKAEGKRVSRAYAKVLNRVFRMRMAGRTFRFIDANAWAGLKVKVGNGSRALSAWRRIETLVAAA